MTHLKRSIHFGKYKSAVQSHKSGKIVQLASFDITKNLKRFMKIKYFQFFTAVIYNSLVDNVHVSKALNLLCKTIFGSILIDFQLFETLRIEMLFI